MKALILAVSMVLVAASCGGGDGDSSQPCGTHNGTCLSSCATPDSSGSCGTGLTCCLPTE
jgi:hypothetical protein